MNPHKIYLGAISGLLVLAVAIGIAWTGHVRDEAKRDAVIEAAKEKIQDLTKGMEQAKQDAQAKVSELEKREQQVIIQPAQAPQIIRELIPTQQPIQQTAQISKDAPDSPSAILTSRQQQELASFALSCKQCDVEKGSLSVQLEAEKSIAQAQEKELAAAKKAAKGGSVWQRTVRVLKVAAIAGGVGYVLGRAAK